MIGLFLAWIIFNVGQALKKPRNVLLAYVDGCDLEQIASRLEVRFREFVESRTWAAKEIAVIISEAPKLSG